MPKQPAKIAKSLRFQLYRQVEQERKSVKAVCAVVGISRETWYKWYRKDHGYGPSTYRSAQIHPHTKLTSRVKLIVYEAKLKYNYGPKKMQFYLKDRCGIAVSTTTIYKYFKKRRLIKKPQRKLPWYRPMKERYVSRSPGENVQLDVKYVPGENQAWNYQFRFADTFTNLQFAVDCLDKSAASTIYAFRLARRYFPFDITGIQTDNGSEFRGMFAVLLQRMGITHRFIPKRSAPWNGKVERANRSVDDEFYLNTEKPWKTLAQYTHWYNYERYHLGKGMHGITPYQKYQNYLALVAKSVNPQG